MKYGLNTPRYFKCEYPGRSIDDLSELDKKQKLYFRNGNLDRLVVAYNLNTADGLREVYKMVVDNWTYGNPAREDYVGEQVYYLWHRLAVKFPWMARKLIKEGYAMEDEVNVKKSIKRIREGWSNLGMEKWNNYA